MIIPYRYFLLIVVAVLSVMSPDTQAGGEPLPATGNIAAANLSPPWIELHFTAGNMAGSVSTSLLLAQSSMSALDATPYTALDRVRFQLVPDIPYLLQVNGSAKALIGGSESAGKIWFDPATGAVLQRDRIRPGKKGVRKIYRFGRDGAFRVRLEPDGRSEANGPPEGWTKIRESVYPYDMAGTGCQAISDPVVLLYFVSWPESPEARGKNGYCLFFDDAVYRVRLESAGVEVLELDYSLKTGTGVRRINGKQEVLKIMLHVDPLTNGADTKDFELLELRGNIAIYVDRISRIPVQISGERGGLGELKIQLKEALMPGTATPMP